MSETKWNAVLCSEHGITTVFLEHTKNLVYMRNVLLSTTTRKLNFVQITPFYHTFHLVLDALVWRLKSVFVQSKNRKKTKRRSSFFVATREQNNFRNSNSFYIIHLCFCFWLNKLQVVLFLCSEWLNWNFLIFIFRFELLMMMVIQWNRLFTTTVYRPILTCMNDCLMHKIIHHKIHTIHIIRAATIHIKLAMNSKSQLLKFIRIFFYLFSFYPPANKQSDFHCMFS